MALPPEIEAWKNLLLGHTLGDFVVREYIDHGHFGIVFGGEHSVSGALAALKVLLPLGTSSDPLIEFQSEGELLAKCRRSSQVVNLIATGAEVVQVTIGGGAKAPISIQYHVLERASGNLERRIASAAMRDQLGWIERLGIWRQAILGIHQMHLKGLTHRDLKSGNCLVFERAGGKLECKISDLGRGRDLNKPPRFQPIDYVQGRGDLRVAAPEFLLWQGRDEPASHRAADLYGLGSLFFELVTGHGITAAALGPIKPLMDLGFDDYRHGRTRDLAILQPSYRQALAILHQELPAPIRNEATALVAQLCAPVPTERQPVRAPGRRIAPDEGLNWLLRQADILQRRLIHCSGSRIAKPTSRSLTRSQ